MTDRPIIFSAPMVKALLEGKKTMTRRLAWREPKLHEDLSSEMQEHFDVLGCRMEMSEEGCWVSKPSPWTKVEPGDRLWVRETWRTVPMLDDRKPIQTGINTPFWYEADGATMNAVHYQPTPGKIRVAIHMPRWASRLTLVVTGVKCERLQEISDADARAEGCPGIDRSYPPRDEYMDLWDRLHGNGAWTANPEVVALSFTVHKRNIDKEDAA